MASTYELITEIVSANDSPFFPKDILLSSEKPIVEAPNRKIAVSKDKRVRVDASKKQLAIILFFSKLGSGFFF